jgi:hypothetical protein
MRRPEAGEDVLHREDVRPERDSGHRRDAEKDSTAKDAHERDVETKDVATRDVKAVCAAGNQCSDADRCTSTKSNACAPFECVEGCCMPVNASAGATCPMGMCDGRGNCVCAQAAGCMCSVAANCPAPAGKCQVAQCESQMCVDKPSPMDTACNENGGTLCNGSGSCVACTSDNDAACTGTGTPYCDTTSGQCVQCTGATGQCTLGCNTTTHKCNL